MFKLFIDDTREPMFVSGLESGQWLIARTYEEAIAHIELYKPQRIAFDHDLGGVKSGMDIAKYLVMRDIHAPGAGYITDHFLFSSHSANPEGRRNILLFLHGYMKDKICGRTKET